MAHILLLEAPGGNDFSILDEAVHLGHHVSFFSGDLAHYQEQQGIQSSLRLAQEIVVVQPFSYAAFEARALALHRQQPFDAILCLIDTRMIEASRLAERLALPFLNAATASLMRDKYRVREIMARHAIQQPAFALATSNEELEEAVERIGFPALIKPSDGYGSQNITVLQSEEDIHPLINPFLDYLPCQTDYGLGVRANDRLVVEQFISGQVIGCDTFTCDGEHMFLGINEKQFCPSPSFAIRGGCFPSNRYDVAPIRAYVCQILDALGFDRGAAHTELLMTANGPYLVEVNPRLVGAQIPHLLGYAFDRSIYADLIDLHLGLPLTELRELKPRWFSVSRWIMADCPGTLRSVTLPEIDNLLIRRITLCKQPGDPVRPPLHNGDRLGYVMTVGRTQEEAEQVAEAFVEGVRVTIDEKPVAAVPALILAS